MADFTINAIFATIFGTFTWNSLPRGWQFIRLGWLALQANADQPDADTNIERQRDMAQGSRYLLAGIAWMLGGLVSAGVATVFIYYAIFNLGVF